MSKKKLKRERRAKQLIQQKLKKNEATQCVLNKLKSKYDIKVGKNN